MELKPAITFPQRVSQTLTLYCKVTVGKASSCTRSTPEKVGRLEASYFPTPVTFLTKMIGLLHPKLCSPR